VESKCALRIGDLSGSLLKGKTMMGRVLLIALSIGLSAEFGEALETAEHGLSAKALEIARPLNFPITNSMVVSWAVAIGLIAFAQIATRKMEQVPTGAQNFVGGVS
jgi:F0F1-type ATP synthase membrane subunit a